MVESSSLDIGTNPRFEQILLILNMNQQRMMEPSLIAQIIFFLSKYIYFNLGTNNEEMRGWWRVQRKIKPPFNFSRKALFLEAV